MACVDYLFLHSNQRADGITNAILKTKVGALETNVVGLASRRPAPGCQIPSQHKTVIDFIKYF